ncbi:putative type VI secretion system effector [Photorhabdus sp. CRCIA-P01]|uniref:putative type VI secretion system effector n=1 Tax=Photorhabdus sp. CRCIA-P01 TaxID=2019570 RepID=UPI000E5A00DC|nr:putative type VI secretion system effector [Photorhabdus sp. CRCIA-P01]
MTKRRDIKEFINFEKVRNELSDAKFYMGLSSYGTVEERNKVAEAERKIPELEALLAKEPPPPELPPKAPLIKVTGILEEFSVMKVWGYFTDREYDPEAFSRKEERDQAGALLLAMIGNTTGAAVTSQSQVRMNAPSDFVRGKINGISFYGWLGMTNAKVGDYVELAVMPKDDHYIVYALANPYERTISMTPCCERGVRAYSKDEINILYVIFTVIAFIILFLGIGVKKISFLPMLFVEYFYLLFAYFLIDFTKKDMIKNPNPTSVLAERIFSALGFPEPMKVDLVFLTKLKVRELKRNGASPIVENEKDRLLPEKGSVREYFYYY